MKPVTDPDLLAQLNAPQRAEVPPTSRVWGDREAEAAGIYEVPQRGSMRPVSDPDILAQLNGQGGISVRPYSEAVNERFGEFVQPSNGPQLQQQLTESGYERTRGPAVPAGVQMLTDFQNQAIAGGQQTTPLISAQMPSLVSTEVHESDAGFAVYRDPATGQMVEVDRNKQVVLRDPADNRLKVFARSENTDEGALDAGARILAPGLAAGSPTARAAIPAAARSAPSRQALFDAADAGYDAARNLGVKFNPSAVGDVAHNMRGALMSDGFDPITAKNTHALLGRLTEAADNVPQGVSGSFNDLESVRRALGKVASGATSADGLARSDAAAATRAIKAIDDFLASPGNAVTAGNAEELSRLVRDARGNYAAASRSARVGRAEDLAEGRTGSAGSGSNTDNALRQRARDILKSPKELRGWSKEEIGELRRLVVGTPVRNMSRLLGKLAPTGAVSAVISGGSGAAIAGPVGAVGLPVAGFAFKKLGDVLTMRQMNKLDEMLRANSPLGRQVQSSFSDWSGKLDDLARVPSAPKVAQFAIATRNFTNNLRDAGINVSPAEFMRSVQGVIQGRAEDE